MAKQKVLVVAAHPDDETLGCGMTLLKHREDGDQIFWLILTNIDETSGWDKSRVEDRQNEIDVVSRLYGFSKTVKLDLPTTRLDTIAYSDLVMKITTVFNEIIPTIIYLPHHSDIHTDHKVTFNAVMSCCKDFRMPFIQRVLTYECLSETEFAPSLKEFSFLPNVFVNGENYFQQKVDIFKVYASEVMAPPLPRSIDALTALARFRGSRIGKKYAEAFCLLYEKIS